MKAAGGGESGDAAGAARELLALLASKGWRLACAESCTGGLVAALITEIPGASENFWGGIVAYSNDCKTRLLGVSPQTIASHGAVSRETAKSMAAGALAASGADLGISVTGIAGPGGGTSEKPVGLVWFAWTAAGVSFEESALFTGDRSAIRLAAAERALLGAARFAADIDRVVGPVYSDR